VPGLVEQLAKKFVYLLPSSRICTPGGAFLCILSLASGSKLHISIGSLPQMI
jgi:hypothetical protein